MYGVFFQSYLDFNLHIPSAANITEQPARLSDLRISKFSALVHSRKSFAQTVRAYNGAAERMGKSQIFVGVDQHRVCLYRGKPCVLCVVFDKTSRSLLSTEGIVKLITSAVKDMLPARGIRIFNNTLTAYAAQYVDPGSVYRNDTDVYLLTVL